MNKLDVENTFFSLLSWKKYSLVDKNIFVADPTKTEIIILSPDKRTFRLVLSNAEAIVFCRVWGLIQEVTM